VAAKSWIKTLMIDWCFNGTSTQIKTLKQTIQYKKNAQCKENNINIIITQNRDKGVLQAKTYSRLSISVNNAQHKMYFETYRYFMT